LRMLAWSAQAVAPGGTLIFATCTISNEENQEVVAQFLESPLGQEFELAPFAKEELAPIFADDISEEGYLSALPKSDGPDGHFAARLRRK